MIEDAVNEPDSSDDAATATSGAVADDVAVTDLLVEEVSIDGMCGVY